MLNNIYRKQIQNLDCLILNWEQLSKVKSNFIMVGSIPVQLQHGLCSNADLFKIPFNVIEEIFESWPNFSGDLDYPVEGTQLDYETSINKFNKDRLSLAKHIRTELFVRGTQKPKLAQKVDKLLEIKAVSYTILVGIFSLFIYLFSSKGYLRV